MSEGLISVGLDVGTTTTQMILSSLQVENRASGFTVPEMAITGREILYKSPVHFTPLQGDSRVDEAALRSLIAEEYRNAGVQRERVDTGAIIITGETSRKENAAAVLRALSDFAGDFVVATAGPDLESRLSAKGAGATEYSEKTGETVLHIDIGGGTSNLSLIRAGKIIRTGCLNVGGRLIKFGKDRAVTYVSPVLKPLCDITEGTVLTEEKGMEIARFLCGVLEMAAGRKKPTKDLEALSTQEAKSIWKPPEESVTLSFSGGVADCMQTKNDPFLYGDLGPMLGRVIWESSLCKERYRLGSETIRATVIGAGCHSTQLSGSTVFCRGVTLPVKNLPVVSFSPEEQNSPHFPALLKDRLLGVEEDAAVIALPGFSPPGYENISRLAQMLAAGLREYPAYICLQADMAKALGQKLSLLLPEDHPCICLDKLKFTPESYLDIGAPVGPCFPVVIKTLVLSGEK